MKLNRHASVVIIIKALSSRLEIRIEGEGVGMEILGIFPPTTSSYCFGAIDNHSKFH